MNVSQAVSVRRIHRRHWVAVWGFALLLMSFELLSAAEPMSTLEFMRRRPQWDKLVGANLQVEGRYSAQVENHLRLVNCDITFHLNESHAEFRRNRIQVVVSGELERTNNGFLFRVREISNGQEEAAIVGDRLRAGDAMDPDFVAEQAAWVAARGEFYRDARLKDFATELYERSLRLARTRLEVGDSAGLLALADRAEQWKLNSTTRFDLLHAATRAELLAEAGRPERNYARIQEVIRQRFASAGKPLAAIPEELAKAYAENPTATYEAAEPADRETLHRLLFLEAAMKQFQQDRRRDGSRGFELANWIESEIPEYRELADQQREAALSFREARVPRMTREEMLEFRALLRQLKQTAREAKMVMLWINSRYAGLPDTPANRVRRAADEFDIVGDPAVALVTLGSALRRDPKADGAEELLGRLGYGWHNGQLFPRDQMPAPEIDKFVVAIREGRILVGMTDLQVRASLGGEPRSIVRLASQAGATELWHYPDQKLTLTLSARRTRPSQSRVPLTVQRIIELPQSHRSRNSDVEPVLGPALRH